MKVYQLKISNIVMKNRKIIIEKCLVESVSSHNKWIFFSENLF